jgi:hypothetical protein
MNDFGKRVRSWEALIARVGHIQHVDLKLKTAWKTAVQFLRNEFGDGFLYACGVNHPMNLALMKFGEHDLYEIVALAELLKKLKASNSNYPLVLGKLKSETKARSEGFPFLEIGRSFLNNGLNIEFSEEIQDQKNPDIKITNPVTREFVLIEVSRIDHTDARKKSSYQFNYISMVIKELGAIIPYAIQLKRNLSDGELSIVKLQISMLYKQAVNDHKIAVTDDDKVRIMFAHPQLEDEFENLCIKQNIRKTLIGAPVDFRDTGKFIDNGKIAREANQIPSGLTGLLYFPVQALYIMADFERIFAAFDSELEKYPQLYGIVLYAKVINPDIQTVITEMSHILVIRKGPENVVTYVAFIQNKFFEKKLSADMLLKIRSAILDF